MSSLRPAAMFFASQTNHVFNIELSTFASVELPDSNLDLGAKSVELIEVIDQFPRDAVLLGLRQRFDLGDGFSKNSRHIDNLACSRSPAKRA